VLLKKIKNKECYSRN